MRSDAKKKRADLLVVVGDGRIFGGWKNAGPLGRGLGLGGASFLVRWGAHSTGTNKVSNSGTNTEWLAPGMAEAWRRVAVKCSAPGQDFA